MGLVGNAIQIHSVPFGLEAYRIGGLQLGRKSNLRTPHEGTMSSHLTRYGNTYCSLIE